MKQQGCESTERGKFVNKCLVDGGHTEGNRSDIWPSGNDLKLPPGLSKRVTSVVSAVGKRSTRNAWTL